MNTIEAAGLDCTGCRSCEQSCALHAITMVEDREGFLYPKIDRELCVLCGQCLKKCPVEGAARPGSSPLELYALQSADTEALVRSASGGVSDLAAGAILERKGLVYGAAYVAEGPRDTSPSPAGEVSAGSRLFVRHIEVTDSDGRQRIQSSKYVQSDPGDTYRKAKQRLDSGQIVLFTGTPCQIAGLYAFLGQDHPLLYTMDLICHGVPSPGLFREYLSYLEQRMGEPVRSVNFRSKDGHGWGTQYLLKLTSKTRTVRCPLPLDPYGNRFMSGDCYRESCYRCQFAGIRRQGDLTIGDFWGVWKGHPDLDSPLGLSSVLVNTPKGQELFAWIREHAGVVRQISLKDALAGQGNLSRPTSRPAARDSVYWGLAQEGYIESLGVGFQPASRLKALMPRSISVLLKRSLKKGGEQV